MFRKITVATCFLIGMCASLPAYSDCPDRDWDNVQKNLEWTLGNDKAKNCAYVKVISGSRNAYEAFADCNDTLTSKNGVSGVDTGAMYSSCEMRACEWFKGHNWHPACAGNP